MKAAVAKVDFVVFLLFIPLGVFAGKSIGKTLFVPNPDSGIETSDTRSHSRLLPPPFGAPNFSMKKENRPNERANSILVEISADDWEEVAPFVFSAKSQDISHDATTDFTLSDDIRRLLDLTSSENNTIVSILGALRTRMERLNAETTEKVSVSHGDDPMFAFDLLGSEEGVSKRISEFEAEIVEGVGTRKATYLVPQLLKALEVNPIVRGFGMNTVRVQFTHPSEGEKYRILETTFSSNGLQSNRCAFETMTLPDRYASIFVEKVE